MATQIKYISSESAWSWIGRLGIIVGLVAAIYGIYVNYHKHRKINELDRLKEEEKKVLEL